MSAIVTKFATKYVSRQVQSRLVPENALYAEVVEIRPNGKEKKRRIKRPIPEGVSDKDGKILQKCRKKAYRLESLFSIIRFDVGWTVIIGIIPFVGPAINLWLGINLIKLACQIEGGLPNVIQSQMYFNATVDFVVTLIPIVGDIVGAVYKSNTRNTLLLEKHLKDSVAQTNLHNASLDKKKL